MDVVPLGASSFSCTDSILFLFCRAIDAINGKLILPGGTQELVVRFAGASARAEEIKLYVGMLDRSTTEDEITKLFEPFGVLKEVHLMTMRETGASKGCAFVKYNNREDAVRAINALHERYQDKNAPGKLIVKFALTKMEKTVSSYPKPAVAYVNPQFYPPQMMMQYPAMMVVADPNAASGVPAQAVVQPAGVQQQWVVAQPQYAAAQAQPVQATGAAPQGYVYAAAQPQTGFAAQQYAAQPGYTQYR